MRVNGAHTGVENLSVAKVQEHFSGAKAHVNLIGLIPGMNPRPTVPANFLLGLRKVEDPNRRSPFDFAQGGLSTTIGAKDAPNSAPDDSRS